ncbi:hypothetical protein CKK33_15955 [Mucilaginibacter sp. MD40]|uniref:hypothetical protein n=1 Tax=Mucilaginibacter sp. MD40 TaxID=2029590 RepID=UPI000BAC6A5B|nr:hypothetical protein [Mucilaginibacter sp. MD40]PAW94908.1 hypothetical protein CKK33_15955 [Mucilaginibacter sp. MD40]
MKAIKYMILLAVGAIFIAGCLKTSDAPPFTYPTGNFSGEFRRITKTSKQTKPDTLKANIKLLLDVKTGYAVTGDTVTLHAGSKGDYAINQSNIIFADRTIPTTTTTTPSNVPPQKVRLNGQYIYLYSGDVFQMLKVVGDTVRYEYDLKKTN